MSTTYRIKELVWKLNDRGAGEHFCECLFGTFHVIPSLHVAEPTPIVRWYIRLEAGEKLDSNFQQYKTADDAKSAAQSWYVSMLEKSLEKI